MDAPTEPDPTQGLSRVASRNAVAAVAARVSALIVGIILTPFVLHKLKAELYGLVIAVGSLYEYLSLLRGGIGGALRRYVTLLHHAGNHEDARKYYGAGFWWGGLLRTVVLIAGLFLAVPAGHFFRLDPSLRLDAAFGIGLVILAAVISDQALMLDVPIFATGRLVPLSMLQLSMGWVRVGVTVLAFTLLVPCLKVYGGASVVVEVIGLAVIFVLAQRSRVVGPVLPRFQLGEPAVRRELLRYGGLALITQLANLLYVSTDNLMIGRFYGPATVTHYSLGTRWSPLILGFLSATVSGLTPLFTSMEARGESRRSRDALLRVVSVTSALAVPLCFVPCVVGDLFLAHWVGPEYRDSSRYMIAMLAPAALDGALSPTWMALLARGRIGWIASGELVVAFGNVGISLLLAFVFKMGPLGFALGNTLAMLSKNLILRPLIVRRDETMPSMRTCLRPLPLAMLGTLPVLILLWLLRPVYGGTLAGVVTAGLIGGLLAVSGSLLLTVGRSEIGKLYALLPRPGRQR
jgi:O-antigen/teichoic acid export membrane protein